METIKSFVNDYLIWMTIPKLNIIDIIEILIIAFAIYHIIVWVKNTRAWMLLKGLVVLMGFWFVAAVLRMDVILWIFEKTIAFGITALLVVFQPEIRKALEQLGRKDLFRSMIPFDDTKEREERFSARTINELVKATYELAKNKTGALIVLEQDVPLNEYERTGITLDSAISSQLLINIFEHNTPLHDGAVIIRENRIVAATCYLPLSDNMELSKELGTRHRAGVGISEVTDSLTIVVSEETGSVSIALEGEIIRNVDGEYLKSKIGQIKKNQPIKKRKIKLWRGRREHETKNAK